MTDATGMPRFSLRTLGSFELRVCTDAALGFTPVVLGEKSCALIAYLWLADRPVPRETLCSLLWERAEITDARNNVRQALFRIRRVLGATSLIEQRDGLQLSAPMLDVDIAPLLVTDGSPGSPAETMQSTFGTMRQPMGQHFVAWRDAVRRQLRRADADGNGLAWASGEDRLDHPHPLGQTQVTESLTKAWQLSLRGVAMSAWVAAATGTRRAEAVRQVRRALRARQARVVVVPGPSRGGQGTVSLWVALAAALWSKPGARGVAPTSLRLLEDVRGAMSEDLGAGRQAVLDLVRAVAEERALAIVMEEPMAFGAAAVEGLVRAVAAMRDTPLLVVLLASPTTAPVSPICLVINGFGDATMARHGAPKKSPRRKTG
jgi:hypothetical protein